MREADVTPWPWEHALKQELNEVLPGFLPFTPGPEQKAEAIHALASFSSRWPESINARTFRNHLESLEGSLDLCSRHFRSRARRTSIRREAVTFFVRTYHGDFCWLPLMFRSLELFAPGQQIVVCVEEGDAAGAAALMPAHVKLVTEPSFCRGTIQQKYSKLTADLHCETDYIVYLDSDSILVKPFDLLDWTYDDKPCLEYTSLDEIDRWMAAAKVRGGNPRIWQAGVSAALGLPVENEFSRRLEKIYRRDWLALMRARIEAVHRVPFRDFMSIQRGTRASSDPSDAVYFSDFNYMGAYIWNFLRDRVHWIDTSVTGFWCRPLCAAQFHSYTMTEVRDGKKVLTDVPVGFFETVRTVWAGPGEPQDKEARVREAYQVLRSSYGY